ncbi:MAG: transcriptional regulator, partial [Aeromonas veronii]
MNEFLKVLLNIRSLRATCRELSLEQLEEALEKLSTIVAERQQDEAAERQAREEHLRKINEYSEMLKAAGI